MWLQSAPPQWPLGLCPPASWSPMAVVMAIAGGVAGLAILNAVLRYAAAVGSAQLSQCVLTRLRADIYDKLQRLSFPFFDGHESSSLINRAAGDAQSVRTFIDGVVIKMFTVLLTLLVYFVYMLHVHAGLTLACLATTPLLWYGAVRFSRRVQPAYRRASELMDRSLTTLVENVNGVCVVKGFGRQPQEIDKFAAANRLVREQRESIFRRVSTFQPLMGILTQCNLLILIGYGGLLVIRGEIPLGAGLFVMANLMQEFGAQISNITNISNTIQTTLVGAQRVFEILDTPPSIVSPPRPGKTGRARGLVRFDSVSFGYAHERPVLRGVDFEVRPGECVAIAGETSAGKTTLLQLIARLYDIQRGAVLVDGVDVREWHLDDLRRNVGFVFQESFLFSNTIAANISFGNPHASPFEIARAARLAAAERFIRELPEGYETLIGEHGSNLSGGQRQRLALARALLLDPPILLLDDAMAAVDAETEHEIQEAIDHSVRHRTTLVVSNRLSTLRRADRILVLSAGRIVQSGRHEQLIAQAGYYRRLAELQGGEPLREARGA